MYRGGFAKGLLVAILLIAVMVGAAYYAYNAGIARGLLEGGKLVAPAAGVSQAPLYPYCGRFIHPFGFGALGCIFPVLSFFLFFGLLRGVFFHRHWGMHRENGENGVPPRFEEWHKRAHEPKPTENIK